MGSPGTTWLTSDVLKNPILGGVAEKLGKTPAQVALRWGLQMGQSVLPKSTHEDRIKQNFDVFNWSIPEDMLSKFSEIGQASDFPHIVVHIGQRAFFVLLTHLGYRILKTCVSMLQGRLVRGMSFVHETSPYKSLEELWDGEI